MMMLALSPAFTDKGTDLKVKAVGTADGAVFSEHLLSLHNRSVSQSASAAHDSPSCFFGAALHLLSAPHDSPAWHCRAHINFAPQPLSISPHLSAGHAAAVGAHSASHLLSLQ